MDARSVLFGTRQSEIQVHPANEPWIRRNARLVTKEMFHSEQVSVLLAN